MKTSFLCNPAPAFTFLVPVSLRVATDAKPYPRRSLIPRTGAHEFLEKCSSDSLTLFFPSIITWGLVDTVGINIDSDFGFPRLNFSYVAFRELQRFFQAFVLMDFCVNQAYANSFEEKTFAPDRLKIHTESHILITPFNSLIKEINPSNWHNMARWCTVTRYKAFFCLLFVHFVNEMLKKKKIWWEFCKLSVTG